MKPILFNAEMVRAILDGRKTVTRRVCKDGNEYTVPDIRFLDIERRTYAVHNYADKEHLEQLSTAERPCPICPGDILYARETWSKDINGEYVYRINYGTTEDDSFPPSVFKWRPSIHMPKEAARLFLRVTGVSVERLQDITEEQARAEGATPLAFSTEGEDVPNEKRTWQEVGQAIWDFINIWNSTIKPGDRGKYDWDASPWVWVIKFERISKEEAYRG